MEKLIATTLISGLAAGLAAALGANWIVIALAGTAGAVFAALLVDENKATGGAIYGFWFDCAKLGVAVGLTSGLATIALAVFDPIFEGLINPYLHEILAGILAVLYIAGMLYLCLQAFRFFCRILKVDTGGF